MAPKRNDCLAAYLETEPPRRTAARLSANAAIRSLSFRPAAPAPIAPSCSSSVPMSAYCFPEVRSPCSTGFWFPKSLESWLRLFLVYCNTKDKPLQTSAFRIKVMIMSFVCSYKKIEAKLHIYL